MSVHLFGAIITPRGVAANNRGLTEGNITTLQKLIWDGQVHTTVSAEAIRFALRRYLEQQEPCNRTFDRDQQANIWKDPQFSSWSEEAGRRYIDDDLLGFMKAEGAKEEKGSESKGRSKGSAQVRRGRLEITRAVSLDAWPGDVTFNAASPGATPSASKGDANKHKNPVPYGTELHATRYQYGFALTPSQLCQPARAHVALQGLCALGQVAGNHGRFLFDFSPASVVLRVTRDPAPRILYGFSQHENGTIHIETLLQKVRARDIEAEELVLGGDIVRELNPGAKDLLCAATLELGVRAASEKAISKLESHTLKTSK